MYGAVGAVVYAYWGGRYAAVFMMDLAGNASSSEDLLDGSLACLFVCFYNQRVDPDGVRA